MRLMVTAVRLETINTSSFGGHQDIVPGRVDVEFTPIGDEPDRFCVEWPRRGPVPEVGSRWTLAPEDVA